MKHKGCYILRVSAAYLYQLRALCIIYMTLPSLGAPIHTHAHTTGFNQYGEITDPSKWNVPNGWCSLPRNRRIFACNSGPALENKNAMPKCPWKEINIAEKDVIFQYTKFIIRLIFPSLFSTKWWEWNWKASILQFIFVGHFGCDTDL